MVFSCTYCMLHKCPVVRSNGLMRETRLDGHKKEKVVFFLYLSIANVNLCGVSLIHYPVRYIHGQYCTLPAKSTLIRHGEDFSVLRSVLSVKPNPVMRRDLMRKTDGESVGRHSLSSLAILQAMFLKAMDVPDILLKRTPLSDRRGNLHTSISHWTRLSCRASPCTQNRRNRSRCS